MDLIVRMERYVNATLKSLDAHHDLLAALKGLRNGLVYGVRIRAPHALVMVFLFGNGTVAEKLRTILQMTKTHAFNLARLEGGKPEQWHSFISAFCVGWAIFGKENGVNTQINLYLLSRIIYGLVKLGAEKGVIPTPSFPVFPWFAATVWGIVLWMFEYHQPVLQNSLQNSMTYLYRDSNVFDSFRNFLLQNK